MALSALLSPTAAQPLEPGSLRGRVVLVTGGSRGLGAAIAQVLGQAGARLVLAETTIEQAQQGASTLAEQDIDAFALALDLADETQCQQAVEAVGTRFGRLDALVNNGAIDVSAPIAELAVADWQRVLDTNLGGPFLMAKHAAALMLRQPGGGHIVNIVSTACKRAGPNASAYHATQWGLLGLSHALHAELRPHGIRVCAVVTGGIKTAGLPERWHDAGTLHDPLHVAGVVRSVLQQTDETTIPEVTVLPLRETALP